MLNNPQYDELFFYTLNLSDHDFIHQLAVDAYCAQHADAETKPIALVFALIGLYLHVEHGITGRQIQRIHMYLAQRRRDWPRLPLPAERGHITIADVLAEAPGLPRDTAIHNWCVSVWQPYSTTRAQIAALLPTPLPR